MNKNKYLPELQDELYKFKEEFESLEMPRNKPRDHWATKERKVFLQDQITKLRLEIKRELIKELETTGFLPKQEKR